MLDGWHLTYGNWVGTWWISRISRTHSLATLRNQFSCSPCSHFSDYFQTASAIANAESSAWHGSEILPDNWRHNEFQNPGIANSVVLGENSCNPSIQYPTEYNRLTRVCTLLRVTPQNTSTPKLSILTVSGDFCRHGVGDWLFVFIKKKLDFFQSSDWLYMQWSSRMVPGQYQPCLRQRIKVATGRGNNMQSNLAWAVCMNASNVKHWDCK